MCNNFKKLANAFLVFGEVLKALDLLTWTAERVASSSLNKVCLNVTL